MNKTVGSLSHPDIGLIHSTHTKYMQDYEIEERNGIIVFLDVLGWKNSNSEKHMVKLLSLTNKLRTEMLDRALRSRQKEEDVINFDVINLSDTIAIFIHGSYPFCELNIFSTLSRFITDALIEGVVFRGAISRGKYKVNKTKQIFIGEAVYEAANYCEAADWAGIILTDSITEALLENNTVNNLIKIDIIQYIIPFKDGMKPCGGFLAIKPLSHTTRAFRDDGMHVQKTDFIDLYNKAFNSNEESVKIKLENTIKFIKFVEGVENEHNA